MSVDHADVPIMELEPGTFSNTLPGETVHLFNGDDAGRGYGDYQRWQLLGISAGVNIPYALLSGDFTEINDRLWRAIFNQFKREIQQVQENFIIPQICRIMWNEFVDRAIISGAITTPVLESDHALYRVKHRVQAWEYVHPVQDVQSDVVKVQNGFKSRAAVVAENNEEDDVESLDAQRKEDADREKEHGLGAEVNVEDDSKPS
jgi:capsid protein